ELFGLIELQSTFYRLPMVATAEKWRHEAPHHFIFTMKAWQVVTHPPTSPTWRRSGVKVSRREHERYGSLKPTDENFSAWEKTVEVAKALNCRVIVLQMSPSFVKNEENIFNAKSFLKGVERPQSMDVGIELRHESWDLKTVSSLCEELDLLHIVDPFKQEPARTTSRKIYYRLHGLGKKPYVYDYSMDELMKLYECWVKPFEEEKDVYVLFNNTSMAADALDFMKIAFTSGIYPHSSSGN
ncbi:MAG: DUF72 domain-containing protein, partial [Desulfurococcaceae archaeon]